MIEQAAIDRALELCRECRALLTSLRLQMALERLRAATPPRST